jgi:hypothetical protein
MGSIANKRRWTDAVGATWSPVVAYAIGPTDRDLRDHGAVRLHVTPEDTTDTWVVDLVHQAAERASGSSDVQVVTPAAHDPYDDGFDAYLQEWTDPLGNKDPDVWMLPGEQGKPVALIIPNHGEEDGSETTDSSDGRPAWILVSIETPESAVAEVARWLARVTDVGLSQRDREMIEVVVREVRAADDDGRLDRIAPDHRAQALAAVDTVAAQLRAPRPSRRIVASALAQIPSYVVGVVSGMTANHLPDLIARLLT